MISPSKTPAAFSIVVPLYNKASYVENTVKSALNQLFTNFEIIIVDDGSTDDSLTIVSALKDPRIRIVTQPNHGVAAARNAGIAVAVNPYIAFLDADDLWDQHYLSHMASLIEQFPQALMYGSSFQLLKGGIQEHRNLKFPKPFIGYLDDFFEKSLRHNYIWTSATVVRKEAFEIYGNFDGRMRLGDDSDMWIRLALHGKVAFSSAVHAYYRLDDASSIIHSKYALDRQFLGYAEKYVEWEAIHPAYNKFINYTRFSALRSVMQGSADSKEDILNFIRQIDGTFLPLHKKIILRFPFSFLKIIFRLNNVISG